jgi:hypothetical protein
MARNEQELYRGGQRSDLPLLLPAMLSMLHYQNLVRHSALEKENGMGEVWKWDLHLVHLLKVRQVPANRPQFPDPCCF